MITTKQCQKLKEQLVQMKKDSQHVINNNNPTDDVSLSDTVDELSSYDNHPADLGTELADREKNYALDDHMSTEIDNINEALQAIEEGTYGKCKTCGIDIPYERLEAIPYTLYCVKHTPSQSKETDRPVEEEILSPIEPNSFETKHDPRINDDIDSFKEVANYGTSETPADFQTPKDSYDDIYSEEKEGSTEPYESFTATDIKGNDAKTYESEEFKKYEEKLDEEHLESPLGDIPYKKRDSYTGEEK
ncbi:TraR/DksA C4-type zinc finger protein [Bacillus sp. 1P06AnD]|uniref:TraR/DksA C4-type zinc finger protein n=1 Tax=Bacillus sp. 1P06AnD TaxID=3132208 RepID=UPI00399FE50F